MGQLLEVQGDVRYDRCALAGHPERDLVDELDLDVHLLAREAEKPLEQLLESLLA